MSIRREELGRSRAESLANPPYKPSSVPPPKPDLDRHIKLCVRVDFLFKTGHCVQYFRKQRLRAKDHVLHVRIVRLKYGNRAFRRNELDGFCRSQFVFRPVASVELALESHNRIQQRNLSKSRLNAFERLVPPLKASCLRQGESLNR